MSFRAASPAKAEIGIGCGRVSALEMETDEVTMVLGDLNIS